MAKLVILNQGMTGRTFEVNVDCTTVGRVEGNAVQIADVSVSSRHAEIFLRGSEIRVRDLNSTNGTFINGEKISEAVLQSGQILRFGQVELKIDDGQPLTAPAAAPVPAHGSETATPPQTMDATMIVPRGVSLNDLEQSGVRPSGFDTNAAFSKKTNRVNRYFIIISVIVGMIILFLIGYLIKQVGG
jgi:pSer/pThr/pTyr-binding forkhead associated (FHA) protein